jgi:hypothetical protein
VLLGSCLADVSVPVVLPSCPAVASAQQCGRQTFSRCGTSGYSTHCLPGSTHGGILEAKMTVAACSRLTYCLRRQHLWSSDRARCTLCCADRNIDCKELLTTQDTVRLCMRSGKGGHMRLTHDRVCSMGGLRGTYQGQQWIAVAANSL